MDDVITEDMNVGKCFGHISKIKSLDMENFRGIKKLGSPLNTDADIVLLTGANGFGKTSVIDALCLILTGYYDEDRKNLLYKNEQKGWVKATIDEGEKEIRVDITKYDKGEGYKITADNVNISPQEDIAKASFYYFDRLNHVFDENNNDGVSLQNILCPLPFDINNVKKNVNKALKNVSKQLSEKEKQYTKTYEENIKKDMQDLYNTLDNKIAELIKGQDRFLQYSQVKDIFNSLHDKNNDFTKLDTLTSIEDLCKKQKDVIMSQLNDEQKLIQYIESLDNDAEDIFSREVLALCKDKIQQINEKINMLDSKRSKLIDIGNHFNDNSNTGNNLYEILTSLRINIEKWLFMPDSIHDYITPPDEILEWLHNTKSMLFDKIPDAADTFDTWLKGIINKREEIEGILNEYNSRLTKLEKVKEIREKIVEIGKTGSYTEKPYSKKEFIDKYKNGNQDNHAIKSIKLIEDLLSEIDQIKKTLTDIEESKKALNNAPKYKEVNAKIERLKYVVNKELSDDSIIQSVMGLSEYQMNNYAGFVNAVLKHFRFVGGLYPIVFNDISSGKTRSKHVWSIKTDDGRTLDMLSTGQKSQLALSLVVGLNLALGDYIKHNIIALDDTSAAFDVSGIAREAIILRQLAYGSGDVSDNDHDIRKQIFIVSHHDGLTNKLIDFLTPPEGRSMHVLRFVDWDPKNGPEIEQYNINPGKAANEESRINFTNMLFRH